VKYLWSLDTILKMKRELSLHSHIISTSTPCQLACSRHWVNILGLEWHFCNSANQNNIFVNMHMCSDVTMRFKGFRF